DTSDRVYWSEEEWDQLADIVWPMRLADTTSALVGLVKKAQEQFPKDRRRNIKTIQQLGPLTTRMQAKVRDTLNCLEQVQRLRDKVDTLVKERKTRDEWVESLTDRDLIYLFSDRLPRIIGELF